MGSNGLTSARHDLFGSDLAKKYPETFDKQIPPDMVYSGSHRLTDIEPVTGITYGKLVLCPTRTYAPVVKEVLAMHRKEIHGMVHCSGGGQTKVLHFIDGLRVVKDRMLPVPPLFHIIQQESGAPWQEMYRVFNMGHRMELYVAPSIAPKVIEISQNFGINAGVIGRVEKGEGAEVYIDIPYGQFVYKK
jgi:phosphoribosylformylglycinamidine cyclo-ligase